MQGIKLDVSYGSITSAQPELAPVETLASLDKYCSHWTFLLAKLIVKTPHECTIGFTLP